VLGQKGAAVKKNGRKAGAPDAHLDLVLKRLEREVASAGTVSWAEIAPDVLGALLDECAAAGWAVMLRSSPMGLTLRLYPRTGDPVVIGPKDVDEMTGSVLVAVAALKDAQEDQGTPG
jgi:hypothetical protein